MSIVSARNYVQSLPKYITLCERNYMRLLRLLPEERKGESSTILLGGGDYLITISEVSKYTTDIDITQITSMIPSIPLWRMCVRLYHDAKVAEVVYPNYHQRVKPSYGYPNPDMHQKDEKYQVNAFLGDWLTLCVENGRSNFHWEVGNDLV
ncbi:Putative cytoplasmic protein [Pseudoalteromonas luteoviolacea B = ATCC 29581]|nr:Putative cytoplasmic protein [Pseudoalteromonas luteoviolacea B = ATCC 29581]